MFMCLFGTFVYGLLYLFMTTYPFIFEGVHGMPPGVGGVGGLPYIGIITGQFLGISALQLYTAVGDEKARSKQWSHGAGMVFLLPYPVRWSLALGSFG